MKQLPIILSLMSLAVAAGAYDVSPSGLSDGTDAAAIQSAIDAAAAGGGGVVRLADGTYHLTSPVTVPAGVELVGNDANRTAVVLDGAGAYRLLDVTGNSALVHGMTFANGYSSLTDNWYHGPVYITAGTVSNCVHRGGRGKYTGALCLGPGATGAEAYVRDTLVYDCTGSDTGGAGIGGGLRLCGSKKAVADGCTVSNCWQGNGYAVYINNAAAQLLSSTITHGSKGGVRIDKDALVSNCVIRANSAPGVYQGSGTVRNSLITGNTASNGGGVYKTGGSLISCTVAGNTATVSGQGVYQTGGTIRDCIIWHNGSSIFLTEEPSLALAGGTCTYTCAAAAPSGNGNIPDKLPAFADPANGDYSLTASSPCRGAAQNGDDMGWRPYAASSTPRVSFSYAVADGAAPALVAFSAALEGDYGAATSYTWVFGDGSAADTSSGATASHTYAAPGRFSVSLEVETTHGGTLRYAVANAVNLGADTVHVVAGAGAGTFPYATEATACSDIFTAVRAVVCSESRPGRVIVHAGTFSSAVEQIILDKPVEVVGAGPDITVLDLNASSGKHRGFFLSHPLAKVRDLTVKRAYWGATEQNGASGARIDTGLVSNCVFRSCKAQYIGSVCVNGANARLLDCEIHGGYHSDSGGAGRGGGLYQTAGLSSGCIVSNCTGNSNGGGVYVAGGTVTNFLIRGCSIGGGQGRAGGLYVTGSSTLVADVVVDGCSMKKNGGYGGGGVYIDNGTLTDAVVTNCSTPYVAGGGIYMAGGTAARTVVAECTAKTTGGGIRQTAGTINHATVTRNSADSDASGIYQTGGSVLNSIVFGNGTATGSTAVNFASTTDAITYSCAPELTAGSGNNITDNPLLRDAPAGDFRLLAASPCIGTADDDGDMGAVPYVFDPTAAPTLTLAVDVAGVISPVTATFSAVLDGTPPAAIVKYVWTFGDGQTAETVVAETTHAYSGYGLFTASVEVLFANDTSLTATLTDAVGSWSDVAYVNPLSATPQSPYETPEKAATTIGDALSVVQVPTDGHASIYLSGGTYNYTAGATYNLTRPIRISTISGERDAVLNGKGKTVLFTLNNAGAAVSGVIVSNVNNASLWGGFTVNNGTVSNCAVIANANGYAGGAYIAAGLIADCLFKDCRSSDPNGTDMHAQGGLRIDGGLVERCVITNCTSGANAGGVQLRGGTFRDSTIANCSGRGLTFYITGGLADRCRIVGNIDGNNGGEALGIYITGGTARNCLVAGNVSAKVAAGIRAKNSGSIVENCTVADNTGTSAGIVSDDSAQWFNCLSWGNTGGDNYGSATLTACSVGRDPLFRDAQKGDYRLTPASPCRDAGVLRDWMADAIDLDGGRRIRGRLPDIGCLEFAAEQTVIILK